MQTKAFGERGSSIAYFGLHLTLFIQLSLSLIKRGKEVKLELGSAVEQCTNGIRIGNILLRQPYLSPYSLSRSYEVMFMKNKTGLQEHHAIVVFDQYLRVLFTKTP